MRDPPTMDTPTMDTSYSPYANLNNFSGYNNGPLDSYNNITPSFGTFGRSNRTSGQSNQDNGVSNGHAHQNGGSGAHNGFEELSEQDDIVIGLTNYGSYTPPRRRPWEMDPATEGVVVDTSDWGEGEDLDDPGDDPNDGSGSITTNPFLPGFQPHNGRDDGHQYENVTVATPPPLPQDGSAFFYMDIEMSLLHEDERFGFSVIGGIDEGFNPRIDEVGQGSPADRADLEVGDEIIEVNGQTLDGATHAEVISHIHQCIKSRTIKLRVKRTSPDENLVPGVNDIQDAYVIAVEDQARQRLERLSALHKVKPVDISKVQDFGNNNLNTPPTSDTDQPEQQVQQVWLSAAPSTHSSPTDKHPADTLEVDEARSNPNTSTTTEEEDQRVPPSGGLRRFSDCSDLGAAGELKESVTQDSFLQLDGLTAGESSTDNYHHQGAAGEDVDGLHFEELSERSFDEDGDDSPFEELPVDVQTLEEDQQVSSSGHDNMQTTALNGYAMDHRHGNMNHQYNSHYSPAGSAGSSQHQENQPTSPPHREMAIDCPSGFVGARKEPPRLPHSIHSSPRSTVSTPSKRSTDSSSTATKRPFQETTNTALAPADELAQMERIKKYQDDLRRRREDEERLAAEQDFLRTSLRGSKKLQELEESKLRPGGLLGPPGIDNPNYLAEEEDAIELDYIGKERAGTLPVRTSNYEGLIQQPLAVDDLFASLHRIQSRLKTIEDQKALVPTQQLLSNPRVQNAVYVHNKVVEVALRQPAPVPVAANAEEAGTDIVKSLLSSSENRYVEELRRLLQKPHIKSILYAHDKVAAQKSTPAKTSTTEDDEREYLYERASQYGEDSIKIVRIQKTADPLGATVRNEGDQVVVGRIVKGGAADKSKLLHEGDEILEINGTDIRGRSVDDVCDLMASLTGTLTFLIVPCHHDDVDIDDDAGDLDDDAGGGGQHGVMHVRAHFDYDPEDDLYIPCRELGISFQKGDILHVINQSDPCWWQAYRDGEEDQALAGLIPSRSFTQQRESIKQTIVEGNKERKKKTGCRCRRHHKKKKKKQMYNADGEDAENQEILTYEEVAQYYPQPNRKRPVVLIGPPYVGRHELRQRLMESDVERFAAAVPHTSRPRKNDETDGKDYHFVARPLFETDIADHKFVEYGEYEKNLYGTSLEAIRSVVNSGRICVLNLHPQSLRILKNSDLKPYVVFVAPPNIEKLKEIRLRQGAKVSDEELKDTIEKAREMEDSFGHYFDYIIVNYDLDRAYDELLAEINRLEVERQWVPAQWVS